MANITISIIIPVYNVEKYLDQCIQSVLSQSYNYYDLILVDDGSTDTSGIICDRYSSGNDKIKVIHKKNGGLSDARNIGIKHAEGSYVMFLDADDFWDDPKALEKLAIRAKETKSDVINYSYKKYCDGRTKVNSGENIPPMPSYHMKECQLQYLFSHGLYIASACNKMIKADLVKEYFQFDKGRLSEDIIWCARLLNIAESYDYVNLDFYCYRQRRDSITHSFKEKSCEDLAYSILECIKLARSGSVPQKKYLYQYAAYQYATFFAVQALSDTIPEKSIKRLEPYQKVLRHYGNNKKVFILYICCKIIGMDYLCKLIRATRRIWSR